MYGTEYSLSVVCKVAEEKHDAPGALRIKTRGWLVEEKEQFGLQMMLATSGSIHSVNQHTFAANSTPMVVRFLFSTLRDPTIASR